MVVGGSGFIGSKLVRSLLYVGNTVINLDIALNEDHDILQNRELSTRYRVVVCDITNVELLTKIISDYKPEVIIHLAALTGVKLCDSMPRQTFDVNTYGTLNVAQACATVGAKLIFASSREVYGETTVGRTLEDDEKRPNNVYGLSKVLAERIISLISARLGLRYTILRFTNVYGPGGDKYGIQILTKKVLRREKLQLFGGDQIMNFLHVDDAVNAIAICLNNKVSDGQVFNVGSKSDVTIKDALRRIGILTNTHVEWEVLPYRPNETRHFQPSLEKIERLLHWSARFDFDEGLAETVIWYKNRVGVIAPA